MILKNKKVDRLIKIIILCLLITIITGAFLSDRKNNDLKKRIKKVDQKEIINISEDNLRKNFFKSKIDSQHDWLSVASLNGAYQRQYYARDTLVAFMGGVEADEKIREKMVHAIDWFGSHMTADGYIPIWFSETDVLNTYYFSPYNRNETSGGIKQLDHQLQFIDAIYLYFKKTNDKKWLKEHIKYAEKARNYLEKKTDSFLLVGDYSEYSGDDWADQVKRSGKSSFVNAYWYKINKDLAEMDIALNKKSKGEKLLKYSKDIKKNFNKEFWINSEPTLCYRGKFGHYIGWSNQFGKFDYFEIDSNSLAVAVGLTNKKQEKSIMNFIDKNFDYFVNGYGATRVLCGFYKNDATKMKAGVSQNGAYWYINSYYLSKALLTSGKIDRLVDLYERTAFATEKYKENGLTEWYYGNEEVGGALNYSWSVAYPIFLSSIVNSLTK